MKVVAVISYKGGVGKTSLTSNLAAELAWRGKKVLLIDLDPQASLTFSFIPPDVWNADFAPSQTIKAWFDASERGSPISLADLIDSPDKITNALGGRGKLDVIYSHLGLINVDLDLATKLGGSNLSQAKRNFISVHRQLANGIERDILPLGYDLVLIDCPPNFNIVTKTALIASDMLLVPARPDYLSTLGIDYLIRSVGQLVGDYNDYAKVQDGEPVATISPSVLGVVFTMVQEYNGVPISAQREFIANVRRLPGITAFNAYIKRNDSLFSNAAQYGVPVVLNHYNSGSHQSVVDGLEEVSNEFSVAASL